MTLARHAPDPSQVWHGHCPPDLAEEFLRRGGTLRIKVRGGSMLPFVRDGDVAHIRAARAAEIEVGTVICYEVARERLVVHRLVGRDGEVLIARGDALTVREPVPPAQLLGRLVALERAGRVIALDTPGARCRARLIAAVAPLTARLLPAARAARRAWSGDRD